MTSTILESQQVKLLAEKIIQLCRNNPPMSSGLFTRALGEVATGEDYEVFATIEAEIGAEECDKWMCSLMVESGKYATLEGEEGYVRPIYSL